MLTTDASRSTNNNILNDVIGCDVIGVVRELKFNNKKGKVELIEPNINSYNIVPKGSYMYAQFLNIFFTNNKISNNNP